MNYREMAFQLVEEIPEADLKCVVAYMQGVLAMVQQPETLNTETIRAIEDARAGIGLSRGFSSAREMLEALDAND